MQPSFTWQLDTEKKFDTLHARLADNGKFLISYVQWLSQDSVHCRKAVKLVEQAKEYLFTRESMETAADVYSKLYNHPNAIDHWETIGHYLPNRFAPKHELLKAYKLSKDTVHAKKIAMKIMAMPVKINSFEVQKIRDRAAEFLEHSQLK